MTATRSRSSSPPRELLVLGYAGHAQSRAAKKRMGEFGVLLGTLAGVEIALASIESYALLAKRLYKRTIDLAWMPPLGWIALDRKQRAIPLVTHFRGGTSQFHAVIIVRSDARIRSLQGLRGKRAAWVDVHSASGFVLPRVQLAAHGVDPRKAFAEERFYGSHEAVVRAVVGGRADFGATYARLDRTGEPVDGAWSDLAGAEESIRVLVAFGRVPADVIVARADLSEAVRERVTGALLNVCLDVNGSMLVREVFGVNEFRRWSAASYEPLRTLAADAHAEGLLETAKISPA